MIGDFARLRIRLFFAAALLTLTVSQFFVSGVAWIWVQQELHPEMQRKAQVIAGTLGDRVERALGFGIPLDRLEGVEDYFAAVLEANPDIARIGLRAGDRVLSQAGSRPATGTDAPAEQSMLGDARVDNMDIRRPVRHAGQIVAEVLVEPDPSFARRQMREVLLDLLAVALVALFIAFEFGRLALDANLIGPIDVARRLTAAVTAGRFDRRGEGSRGAAGDLIALLNGRISRLNAVYAATAAQAAGLGAEARAQLRDLTERFRFAGDGTPATLSRARLVDARLLTFVFMFAEGLARPWFPVYVKGFLGDGVGLPPEMAAALPIAAFMLVVALSMPLAGGLSERMGRRRSFVLGAALSAGGLVGSGLAVTFHDLLLWRVLDGLGYALMFMACQGFVIDNTPERQRAEGVALFVGGIMAAEICAPAVGGILADRIGDRATFIVAGCLTVLVLLLALRTLHGGAIAAASPAAARPQRGAAAMLARNPRFIVLAITAGIPAKMLLTGFLFFLVPVFLADLGANRSDIGRIAMLYGVPTLFLMPVFSRLADRWNLHGFMVGLGGMIAGLGMLPILFWTGMEWVLVGVVALGLGQAMSISPQITLAARLAAAESAAHGHGPVLGVFRMIERCGSAAGPLVFGAMTAAFGPADTMALGGALTAAGALIFSVVFLTIGIEPDRDDAEEAPQNSEHIVAAGSGVT